MVEAEAVSGRTARHSVGLGQVPCKKEVFTVAEAVGRRTVGHSVGLGRGESSQFVICSMIAKYLAGLEIEELL